MSSRVLRFSNIFLRSFHKAGSLNMTNVKEPTILQLSENGKLTFYNSDSTSTSSSQTQRIENK